MNTSDTFAMHIRKSKPLLAILATTVFTCAAAITQADKPPHAGGGGGGGDSKSGYSIMPFLPPGSPALRGWVGDLNEPGDVVGGLEYADGSDEALHLAFDTGTYTSLSSGGQGASANGINDLGQIVGVDNQLGAVVWTSPTANPIDLPIPSGAPYSGALDVNGAGIIIGGDSDGGTGTALVWRLVVNPDGSATVDGPLSLAPLDGDFEAFAYGISEVVDGTALLVGSSRNDVDGRAVIWTVSLSDDGTLLTPEPPLSLGTLGLYDPSWSEGRGLNDLGDVCGTSDHRPFISYGAGALVELELPNRSVYGGTQDVNNPEEVVGWANEPYKNNQTTPIQTRAILWRNGSPVELIKQIDSKSGWDALRSAFDINDSGMITGQGRYNGVSHQGFVMIPES